MNLILVMIPLSLLLLSGAIGLFFWAVNKGQFDDMDSPSLMPLEDNLPQETADSSQEQN
ncbi:MAG: cbb3-type cytochrome oxidase assembly protein CcoS [Venatoribacter sp.]